ncbi:MAG: C69 family dipeptidase [Actinomycetota bacterium]|nr:C69 family dipeptidase [Actinomycetota bacterium]
MSYALYVGRELTAEGVGFLAGYGDEPSSHWLEIVPRQHHMAGTEIKVGMTPQARMPGVRSSIPQVGTTSRHLCVSYSQYLGAPSPLTNGGLNEHGVAVRDVWSPSHPRLVEMTPTDQRGPNYSDLARLVLQRCRTARQGVELIGRLIAEHGDSTYGGNSHLIADADEAWVVVEFAGGAGLWVAERLGSRSIRVSRPGYVSVVPADFAEREDYAGAAHLIEFAVDRGWYRRSDGPFDANVVYGDGRGRWDGVVWMEDELARRAAAPERLAFEDICWALRSERLTGDTAGYGQVVPLLPASELSQLRILWHAVVGPVAAPFAPVPLGVARVEPEFARHRYLTAGESSAFVGGDLADGDVVSSVPQAVEATRSAVAVHKRLLYLLAEHHEVFLPEVTPVWTALEGQSASRLASVLESARLLIEGGRLDLAEELLTRFSSDEMLRGLDLAEAMVASMEARARLLFGVRESTGWRGPEVIW